MTRLWRVGLTACVAVAVGGAAMAADIVVYYRAAGWDAFSGQDDNGQAVCGIGSTNPRNGGSFAMRFPIGGQDVTFAAGKAAWSIPEGRQVKVVMQVGQEPPWTQTGIGHDHQISWTLDSNAIQVFDQQFRRAGIMTLAFPEGSEPPWTISLAGSTAISNAFGRCITDLTQRVQGTNAPPVNQGPTQPFSATPADPQPETPPR